jgi:phospholipid-binding lipoprotein MlaA
VSIAGFGAALLLARPATTYFLSDAISRRPVSVDSVSDGTAAGASRLIPEPISVTTPDRAEAAQGQDDIVVTARSHSPGDPLESINVKSFAANEAVDKAVIGPVTHTYMKIVPHGVQVGVSNLLSNLHEPVVMLNFALQLKLACAAETAARFTINSTIGVGGVIDIAARKPFRLPKRPNGFADTMGYYGVKTGAFLFVPVFGATTVRDLVGNIMDRGILPVALGAPFNRPAYFIPVGLGRTLDNRATLDEKLNQFRNTPDFYKSRRDYYLQLRQAEIDELHHRGRQEAVPVPVPVPVPLSLSTPAPGK